MTLRAWVKHFLVYGLGVVLMYALPALMIPIYTYRVTPSIYGVVELLNRSQDILLIILSFGLGSAAATFYQMRRGDAEGQKTLYSTCVQYIAAFSFAIVVILLPFSARISKLLFGSPIYAKAVVLILLSTYFEGLFQAAVLYLQSELRSVLYVSTFTARSIAAISLNFVLVFWWRWGLMGIVWATFLHTSLFAIAVAAYMFRCTGFHFDRKLMRELLAFGAPLVVGGFAMFVLNNGDRYFLEAYRSSADLGIYGVGYKLGTVALALLMYPFMKIWSVTMVDIARSPDGPKDLGRIATYLIAGGVFITLGVSLFAPYVVRLVAQKSYWAATSLIPVVGLAYIFYAWSVVMDASFYITKRTVYKMIDVTLAGLVVLGLYWWWIPSHGMIGAAWATVGGFAAFAGFKLYFAQKVFRINYEYGRIAWLFVAGSIIYVLAARFPDSWSTLDIGVRLIAALLFPVALWIGGFLEDDERRAMEGYWQTFRMRYLRNTEA